MLLLPGHCIAQRPPWTVAYSTARLLQLLQLILLFLLLILLPVPLLAVAVLPAFLAFELGTAATHGDAAHNAGTAVVGLAAVPEMLLSMLLHCALLGLLLLLPD